MGGGSEMKPYVIINNHEKKRRQRKEKFNAVANSLENNIDKLIKMIHESNK